MKREKKKRPYIRRTSKRYSIDTEAEKGQVVWMRIIGVSKDDKVKQCTLRGTDLDESWAIKSFKKHLSRN